VPFPHAEDDFTGGRFHRFERKLRDEADFMFDIHVEIVRHENRPGLLQDFRELARRQPVIRVIGKPSLQAAQRVVTLRAAAIYESLVYACHFRDVSMSGDGISVRQKEADIRSRMLVQTFFQFSNIHKDQHFRFEPAKPTQHAPSSRNESLWRSRFPSRRSVVSLLSEGEKNLNSESTSRPTLGSMV
jgi:hypothetical protein